VLKFDTICIKDILWAYYVKECNFLNLLLSNYLISTYLNHPKINSNFMLALNFGAICFCKYLILTEVVKDYDEFPIYLDAHILY
jgi:hypothetical protein